MDLPDIKYKDLLLICQKDKEIAKEYFKKIFNKVFNNYCDLQIEKPLSLIMGTYPLPNEFNISILKNQDAFEKRKDYYFFTGTPGDRILFSTRRLPIVGSDPVPFMFPITKTIGPTEKITKPILSNTFYFEIFIYGKQFRKGWANECLSLGFGTVCTNYKNQVGWTDKSWGFHSDDGFYINNNISKPYSEPWEPNDTIGVGLTYVSKNNYKIFLTKNGLLCNDEESFTCEDVLIPMIGFDYSYPVKVNWGTDDFLFDLEKYVSYSQILSTTNTFLSNKDPIDYYNVSPKTPISNLFQIFANNKKNINNNEIYKSFVVNINNTETSNKNIDISNENIDISNQISGETIYNGNTTLINPLTYTNTFVDTFGFANNSFIIPTSVTSTSPTSNFIIPNIHYSIGNITTTSTNFISPTTTMVPTYYSTILSSYYTIPNVFANQPLNIPNMSNEEELFDEPD